MKQYRYETVIGKRKTPMHWIVLANQRINLDAVLYIESTQTCPDVRTGVSQPMLKVYFNLLIDNTLCYLDIVGDDIAHFDRQWNAYWLNQLPEVNER